jgi:methionyl-tRNA synthetase
MTEAVMSKRTLVTAALPYANGRPHVGHVAGCYLPADIYVRYLRLRGREVKFICGSDDHGAAIQIAAEKAGQAPGEMAKHFWEKQKASFEGIDIHFDVYGSTSRTPGHAELSQKFFLSMHEKGYFEKKSTPQFYDSSKQMFLADRYVKGTCGYCNTPDQNGDQCENCGKTLDVQTLKDARSTLSGTPATVKDSTHWFLDLTKFEKPIRDWVEKASLRDHSRAYVKSMLDQGLVKRAITRDLTWGIPVPLKDAEAQGKVLYVWFDAPIGYISNTAQLVGQEHLKDWWASKDCEVLHFIGEDNTIFHCVIWIAMLAAEGSYQLPKGVLVNQFLNIQFPDQAEAEKISKSRGRAVWIEDYVANGGDPDVLRYYLTMIAPERARTVYLPADLISKNNTDLANVLGNFVNRILSFTQKYIGLQVPEPPASKLTETDRKFMERMAEVHRRATNELDGFSPKNALNEIMEFARECNKYVDDKAPWKTRKDDMETTAVTLHHAIQAIKFLAVVLQPFMPRTGEKMAKTLGLTPEERGWDRALEPLKAGRPFQAPEILFTKIEDAPAAPKT